METARTSSRRPRGAAALVVLLAGLAAAGCGGARRGAVQATELPLEPTPPTRSTRDAAASPVGVWHVVSEGQTLWRIARVYGCDLDELARVNGISDPTALEEGRPLFVPGADRVREVPAYPAPIDDVPPELATPGGGGFDWPVAGGRVLSGYGARRRTHRHQGIDISGRPGQAVLAARSGRVVYSGSTLRGYGKTIILDHGDGLRSLYAHNSKLLVREGTPVERGQVIARVGRTGNASTEHCHFEIRRHDRAVDPLSFLTVPTESTR
jgi:lipoprotein NlpD